MNESAKSSNTSNSSDGGLPPPPPAPPVSGDTPSRDRRIDSLLGVLNLADKAWDEAGGKLAFSLASALDQIESDQDQLTQQIGGPYLASAQKSDKKFERGYKKLDKLLNQTLGETEFVRDQAVRSVGGDVPMVLSEIANAVADNTLDALTDKYMTVPMAEWGQMQQLGVNVDHLVDPVFVPPALIEADPPPPSFDTAPPAVSPPFISPPPSPFDPPPTVPPFVVPPGGGPPIGIILPPGIVPPTVPPPRVPPTVPPASSCLPGDTVQVGCENLAYPWVSKWWVVAKCGPSCSTALCYFYGPNPPPVGQGEYLYGPYDQQPDGAEKERIARAVCRTTGTAPPESPPTAPPPPGVPAPAPIPPGVPAPGQPNDPPRGQPPVKPPQQFNIPTADCQNAADWIKAANGGEFGTGGSIWSNAFNPVFDKWLDAMSGNVFTKAIPAALGSLGSIAFGSLNLVYDALGVPNATAQGMITGALGSLGWVERVTGAPASYLGEEWQQYMRFAAPMFLPDQGAVNTQFLAGAITKDDWECLTKFNGNKVVFAERTVEASRTRPDVLALIGLKRRGVLTDEQYRVAMRQQGVTRDADRIGFERATETVPQVSDIFRYIKKDVTNEEFVQLGELDEGFPEAYSGKIKEMGDAIGLQEAQARFEYRAEWEFPSRTEATEMFRRLRPGRDVRITQTLPDGTVKVVQPKPFTVDDYYQVLKVNDVAPGFRDKSIAVSYVPISLTDIKALQKNGVIDKAEAIERLQDIGKSPDDAAVLAELVVRDNARMLSNETGGWTRRKVFKEFADGSISYQEADKILERTMPDKATRETVLGDAVFQREVDKRKECIRGIKRRYFTAEIEADQATKELVGQGMSEDAAFTIVEGWKCKRASRSKEPTVKLLVEWWIYGVISIDDLYARLQRLGYTIADARRIVIATQQKEEEKRLKAEQSALEKAERKRRQIEREQKAAERDRLRGRTTN